MAREILSPEQLSEDGQLLYDALNGEAPLPCALIAGAFMEKALASLLHKFFIKSETAEKMLDENTGRLGQLSSRLEMAYCLGLISKTMLQNVTTIGRVRNTFAHSHKPIDFDDPQVVSLCNDLKQLKPLLVVGENAGPGSALEEMSKHAGQDARSRFTFAAVLAYNRLVLVGLSTKRQEKPKWSF